VDIISISWGIDSDSTPIRSALTRAVENDVIVLASASNNGLNDPIPFPANIGPPVFCIGSADSTGRRSNYSPVAKGVEKFSVVGEGVVGASISNRGTARINGTSTATPVAAGIASLLIAYTRQFDPSNDAAHYDRMRKLFLAMSRDSKGRSYRFLAPWSLFELEDESQRRALFKSIISGPPSTSLNY